MRRAVSILAPVGVLAVALLLAPLVPRALDARFLALVGFAAFVGGAATAVLAAALGARLPWSTRALAVTVVASIVVVVAQVAMRSSSPWIGVVVDGATLAGSVALGAFVGARIQHPGHLFPACAVAACADVVSVYSPRGPSHAIASSDALLSFFAIGFPLPGARVLVPTIGLGDVVFVALLLAATHRHAVGFARVVVLACVGLIAAGIVAFVVRDAVPALPFVAVAVIAGAPKTRTLARRDRTVATVAIGVSLAVAAWTLVRALGHAG